MKRENENTQANLERQKLKALLESYKVLLTLYGKPLNALDMLALAAEMEGVLKRSEGLLGSLTCLYFLANNLNHPPCHFSEGFL